MLTKSHMGTRIVHICNKFDTLTHLYWEKILIIWVII